MNNEGSNGNYWSSTYNNSSNAYNLNFNSSNVNTNNNNRYYGFTVRAVQHSLSSAVPFRLTRDRLLQDLYIAFYDARRRKSNKSYVRAFERNLKDELESLCDDLINRTYKAQPSTCFVINYPKKREVFAAQFRDRVVHHLYYNYTHVLFERTFIQDTYSCIKGRGTHYGFHRLASHMRKETQNWQHEAWVMKLDIRGYFMHIDRQLLANIALGSIDKMSAHRAVGNKRWDEVIDIDFIKWLTSEIILLNPTVSCRFAGEESDWIGLDRNKSLFYAPSGCGLPIGNLTSQLFSNVYLNVFDQYMKRVMGCKHYGRYVDDAYVVSCDKEWLKSLAMKAKSFLLKTLHLELHLGKLIISRCNYGTEFLGGYVKPFRNYVSNHTLRRLISRIVLFDLEDKEKVVRCINSSLGMLRHYRTYHIRRNLFMRKEFLCISYYNRNITKMYVNNKKVQL